MRQTWCIVTIHTLEKVNKQHSTQNNRAQHASERITMSTWGIFLDVTFIFPRNVLLMIELFVFFVPFSAECKALMNQDMKSTLSPENERKNIFSDLWWEGVIYAELLSSAGADYLVQWFGTASWSTAPQPAASRGEIREPWSCAGSTVCATILQISAPAGSSGLLAAASSARNSPSAESNFSAELRVRKPAEFIERKVHSMVLRECDRNKNEQTSFSLFLRHSSRKQTTKKANKMIPFLPEEWHCNNHSPWCCWVPQFLQEQVNLSELWPHWARDHHVSFPQCNWEGWGPSREGSVHWCVRGDPGTPGDHLQQRRRQRHSLCLLTCVA